MKHIDKTLLQFLKKSLEATKYSAAQRTVTTNGIFKSSENRFLSANNNTIFSNEIKSGGITDQKNSGTCWLFSTLNILRHEMAANLKLEEFELSQSYSLFYDKLEKSNSFYENIIASADRPLDDRLVSYYLDAPQYDGGWWEMSAAVIQKYGVVPSDAMPAAEAVTDTSQLNRVLNKKLRKDALTLRKMTSEKKSHTVIETTKQKMLAEIYKILIISIGTPPEVFDFVYRDTNKKYHREPGLTPKSFLKKYSKLNLNNYISLVNDPTSSKKYNQLYVIDNSNNAMDALPFTFLNIEMPLLKELACKQILSNEAVWFACDILSDSTKKGYMASDIYDFNETFDLDLTMNKADRLVTHDSGVTHAMTLTGVDIVEGKTTQWKVENSWGKDAGHQGYFSMSDKWMDQNGFVVVIRKDLLPSDLKQKLKQRPISLPLWDHLN